MRRIARATRCFAVIFLAAVAACTTVAEHPLVPNEQLEPIRGRAVATALHRIETAQRSIDALAERPRASCRAPLPRGAITVSTTLTWHGKRSDGSVDRWSVLGTWSRDGDGDVRSRREVQTLLPDGRPTRRVYEARVVGGRSYVAIDDRFADASRDPRVAERTLDESHRDIDDLLSMLQWREARLVAASAGEGLCATDRVAPDLPLHAAELALSARGRRGWLRWSNASRSLTVSFEEATRHAAENIDAPDETWPIDEDRSWMEFDAFRSAGLEAGWWVEPAEGDEP